MRPKSKAAQRSAADQRAAFADARNLALELAGINTPFTIDAMAAGLVLERGELGRRMAELWLRMRLGGTWSQPGWSQVLILGLMVFGWLWGIVGLLLAVPLLACTKVVLERVDGLGPWARLLE